MITIPTLLFCVQPEVSSQSEQSWVTPGVYVFAIPWGVRSISVQVIGGGGGGSRGSSYLYQGFYKSGWGGARGHFRQQNAIAVDPGSRAVINVGLGGHSGGGAGESSSFIYTGGARTPAVTIVARGGHGGAIVTARSPDTPTGNGTAGESMPATARRNRQIGRAGSYLAAAGSINGGPGSQGGGGGGGARASRGSAGSGGPGSQGGGGGGGGRSYDGSAGSGGPGGDGYIEIRWGQNSGFLDEAD